MGVVYLDCSKAVSAAYHSILTDKLMKWAEGWTENQLPYWAQSVVITGTKSRWRPVPRVHPKG